MKLKAHRHSSGRRAHQVCGRWNGDEFNLARRTISANAGCRQLREAQLAELAVVAATRPDHQPAAEQLTPLDFR